jgi:5'-3' exonuclease
MGVDNYGRMPKIGPERPKQIIFKSSTDEGKQECRNKVKEWEVERIRNYIRSNWRSCRPIHYLSGLANVMYELKVDLSYRSSNGNKGLQTQENCERLANALELMLNDNFSKEFMEDDSNVIQVAMEFWVVTGTGESYFDEEAELNEQYPYGTFLFAPVVTKKGVMVESESSCSLKEIKDWILFLRG